MKIKIALIDPCPIQRSVLKQILYCLIVENPHIILFELAMLEDLPEEEIIDLIIAGPSAGYPGNFRQGNTAGIEPLVTYSAADTGKEKSAEQSLGAPGKKSIGSRKLTPETEQLHLININLFDGIHVLTNRERQILSFLIQGKRIKEISFLMGLKYSTVSSYKYRIYEKLEVDNIVDLTKKILQYMK